MKSRLFQFMLTAGLAMAPAQKAMSDACAAALCLYGSYVSECGGYRSDFFNIKEFVWMDKTNDAGESVQVLVFDPKQTYISRKDWLSACPVDDGVIGTIMGKHGTKIGEDYR